MATDWDLSLLKLEAGGLRHGLEGLRERLRFTGVTPAWRQDVERLKRDLSDLQFALADLRVKRAGGPAQADDKGELVRTPVGDGDPRFDGR